jgi:hypothetical protein
MLDVPCWILAIVLAYEIQVCTTCQKNIFSYTLFYCVNVKSIYTFDMKTKTIPKNRHHKLQDSYIKKISQIGHFIEGSLCEYKRPGRKSSSWQLTYKVAGKTQTVYVPVEMVEEVRQWTQEYKLIKKLIRKETKESLAIIQGYTASRLAANRNL